MDAIRSLKRCAASWCGLRLVAATFVVLALMSARAVNADDGDPSATAKRISALEKRVRELESRERWMRMCLEGLSQRGEGYEPQPSGAERAVQQALERSTFLPEQPSKDDVRRYVATVLTITLAEGGIVGATDAPVRFLVAVGPQHVDVLLEGMLLPVPTTDYLVAGVGLLAGPQHKDLILRHLRGHRQLVRVVVQRGWVRDAAPVLLREVRDRNRSLDSEWIAAAAEVARPDDIPHFVHQIASTTIHGLCGKPCGASREYMKRLSRRSPASGTSSSEQRRSSLQTMSASSSSVWPRSTG